MIQINDLLKNDSLSINQFEDLIMRDSLYRKVIQKYMKKEIYWTSLNFAECNNDIIVVPINGMFGIDSADAQNKATLI